jgi:hypothetical protein
MDNRTKIRLHTICLVSLFPAAVGLFGLTTESRAQSGKPAGPVGWYRPTTTAPPPTSTTSSTGQSTQPQSNAQGSTSGTNTPTSQVPGSPQAPVTNGNNQAPGTPPGAPGTTNNPNDTTNSNNGQTNSATQNSQPPTAPSPSNPMLVIDPVNGGENNTAYYDANGRLQMGQTTPEPDLQDFRKSPFGEKKEPTQLDYFGYDYFKPAQDLIDARRLSLMQRSQSASTANSGQSSQQQNNSNGMQQQQQPSTFTPPSPVAPAQLPSYSTGTQQGYGQQGVGQQGLTISVSRCSHFRTPAETRRDLRTGR